MSVQIYSYGAFIRMVTNDSVLLVAKDQIKTVETVRDDTIKISFGEGTLGDLFIKLVDVTAPSGIVDIAALRDVLAHMLDYSNEYEELALNKQQLEIEQLIEIKQVLNLWHSTQQIDLNFQQLQVNALIAIGNRLLEEKENSQQILTSMQDQTLSVKEQTVKISVLSEKVSDIKSGEDELLTKQDAIISLIGAHSIMFNSMVEKLGVISTTDQSLLNKQDSLTGVLTDTKVITGQVQTTLADILNELKSQTNKLSTMDTTLNDLRSQHASLISKQDTQNQLLTDIKQLLANTGTH